MGPAIPLDSLDFSDDYAIDTEFAVQDGGTIAQGQARASLAQQFDTSGTSFPSGSGPTIQWKQAAGDSEFTTEPSIQWKPARDPDIVDFGTLAPVVVHPDTTAAPDGQSMADKAFYTFTHQGEISASFGKGLANGFYEGLRPIGEFIGEEAARYSLGQYDQTALGKLSNFVVGEELNGFPQTRAFGDAIGGTIDGIVSDIPNALSEGYDFAKGAVSSAGSSLLDWLDRSSASEIAEGAGNEVGKFAALDGVGRVADLGIAAGGLITRQSGTLSELARVPSTVETGPGGVDLQLRYKDGWTNAQRAEADAKVQILNDSDTVVTQVDRSGTSASSRYRQSGGLVQPGYDVDHIVDLQLGGADNVSNMWPLNSSVNRSLGAQIQWQIKGLPPGTVINRVTIGD